MTRKRDRVVASIVGSLLAAVAVALTYTVVAGANHEPQAKCSRSGDTCASARENNRAIHVLSISSFGLRGRIDVCSRRVGGTQKCIERRMKQDVGDIHTSRVRWEPNFLSRRGAYVITWEKRGDRVGPRLGVHER